MKRVYSIIFACAVIFSLVIPTFALNSPTDTQVVLSTQETVTEDGLTITDELTILPQTRSTTSISATLTRKFSRAGVSIATIAITGKFKYTGTSVSVTSKSVSQADTYNGWSYTRNSFTSSGGTITLTGKLTKLLTPSASFTMKLSCDKDGNVSNS